MDLISTLIEADKLRAKDQHEKARELLVRLALEFPTNPVVQYKTACVYDYIGQEKEAIPYYLAAIENDLPGDDLRGAYLGLGSTYRTLGQYAESKKILQAGLGQFPDANEMKIFLAMTLYNLGEHHEAVSSLIKILAETTSDEKIIDYERAILFYAEDLNKKWD
ncbi:tetratricopeptide repeat protein [Candidatus Villigracilis saccharophilus]|uniref:tetratricopeptide repeat protein n=1 Tax=Candidatus Villigracilis saccharophilus TaxID=3140684 RepID=UPI0031346DE3|nr:tetratricopeptide repeat protein [Anaerolineales bacterium]